MCRQGRKSLLPKPSIPGLHDTVVSQLISGNHYDCSQRFWAVPSHRARPRRCSGIYPRCHWHDLAPFRHSSATWTAAICLEGHGIRWAVPSHRARLLMFWSTCAQRHTAPPCWTLVSMGTVPQSCLRERGLLQKPSDASICASDSWFAKLCTHTFETM